MSEASIVAIIVAILGTSTGFFSFLAALRQHRLQAKRDAHNEAMDLIDKLTKRLDDLEADLDKERQERKALEKQLENERELRLAAERELSAVKRALTDATEARQDRINRITELEAEVSRLKTKLAKLEKTTGELKGPEK